MSQKSALFVCLGNICRSPIAEGCFKQLLSEQGVFDQWKVDSAATSRYQIGDSPDERGRSCMEKHGIYKHVAHHRARQITQRDFEDFDFIFGMDESNMRNLHQVAPKNHKSKILLLATYCPDLAHDGVIEDPYYSSSQSAFEEVYQQCVNACANFLKSI